MNHFSRATEILTTVLVSCPADTQAAPRTGRLHHEREGKGGQLRRSVQPLSELCTLHRGGYRYYHGDYDGHAGSGRRDASKGQRQQRRPGGGRREPTRHQDLPGRHGRLPHPGCDSLPSPHGSPVASRLVRHPRRGGAEGVDLARRQLPLARAGAALDPPAPRQRAVRRHGLPAVLPAVGLPPGGAAVPGVPGTGDPLGGRQRRHLRDHARGLPADGVVGGGEEVAQGEVGRERDLETGVPKVVPRIGKLDLPGELAAWYYCMFIGCLHFFCTPGVVVEACFLFLQPPSLKFYGMVG